MQDILKNRSSKLFDLLAAAQIESILISKPENIIYLTGIFSISQIEREAFILAHKQKLYLLVSALNIQSYQHLKHVEILELSANNRLSTQIKKLLSPGASKLYIEAADLSYQEAIMLRDKLELELTPFEQLDKKLRLIKDSLEKDLIAQACNITAKTYSLIKPNIKPGVSEKEIAHLLVRQMENFGADGIPHGFEPIVAFGAHTAIPHHHSSAYKLSDNQPVLLDFGCHVQGYASDFTRTFWIGDEPDELFLEIEQLINQAYNAAIEQIKPDNIVGWADQAIRDIFAKKNYQSAYLHSAGHGLGLGIHEAPSLYYQNQEDRFIPGMALTLEPGLYFPHKFGYRFENTLLVTETGQQNLTDLAYLPD